MTNKKFFWRILVMGLVFGMMVIGCDDGSTNATQPPDPLSVTYVSEDSDGNLYTLEITEALPKKSARYTAKQGDTFKLTVELYNNGNYSLALTYSGTIASTIAGDAEIVININVNGEPLSITIAGTEMTLITGKIVDEDGEAVVETPDTLSPVADKTALGSAISAANTAKQGVVVSVNGTDITKDVYWVTQTQMDTFAAAIATAQAFYDEGEADQSMVNSARITLIAATNVFNGQKKLGTKEDQQEASYDVYVAGGYLDGEDYVSCYWKNGQPVTISSTGYVNIVDIVVSGSDVYILGSDNWEACYWKNGSTKVMLPNSVQSPRGIAISGSDVYVIGVTSDGDDNWIASYWKNGVLTTLSAYPSNANDIIISGTDVYITGYDELDSYMDDYYRISVSKACYWKNGNRILLTDRTSWADATSISVSGSDIYILGNIITRESNFHCYWKNGVQTNLTDGTIFTVMDEMVVSNSDVYVLGREQPIRGGAWYPAYWKNGVKVFLTGMGNYGGMYGSLMAVSDSNVYVAGNSNDIACYWKNGVKIPLSLVESRASAIAILGSDIYVVGWISNGTQNKACYWKNGTLTMLSEDASASSIFVVKK